MVMWYNKFYKNMARSAEVHVLDDVEADLYGIEMWLLVTGFIREEKDYTGVEELIEDIRVDCEVARRSFRPRGLDIAGDGKGTLDGSWLVR